MSSSSPSSSESEPPKVPWHTGLAPQVLTPFVWIAFLDQLGSRGVPMGGLAPTIAGVWLAAFLGTLLFFDAPTAWSFRAGRPLMGLAASTFGEAGARWVPGLVVAFVQVIWLAIAAYFALDLTLDGLVSAGWLEASAVRPRSGPAPIGWRSSLFLVTAPIWVLAFALVGFKPIFVRMVLAIMKVFPLFPQVIVGGVMLWILFGPGSLNTLPQRTPEMAEDAGRWPAIVVMLRMVGGFIAALALGAVDWGRVCRDTRDVRLGGWVGIAFGAGVLGTIALVTVAGGGGPVGTYRNVLQFRIGGLMGTLCLFIMALASMAPAVYAAHILSRRLKEAFPKMMRLVWSIVGGLLALPLVMLGVPERLDILFDLLGAAAAPVLGAMTVDALRHRGRWTETFPGVRRAGMIAWGIGTVIGLVGPVSTVFGIGASFARIVPTSWLGYAASALAFAVLASMDEKKDRATIAA